jgi:hypothetical protein
MANGNACSKPSGKVVTGKVIKPSGRVVGGQGKSSNEKKKKGY